MPRCPRRWSLPWWEWSRLRIRTSRAPGCCPSRRGPDSQWPEKKAKKIVKLIVKIFSHKTRDNKTFAPELRMSNMTFVVLGTGQVFSSLTFVYEAEGKHYWMLLVTTKCYPTKLSNVCILFKCYLQNTNITEFSRLTFCMQSSVTSAYVWSQSYKCNWIWSGNISSTNIWQHLQFCRIFSSTFAIGNLMHCTSFSTNASDLQQYLRYINSTFHNCGLRAIKNTVFANYYSETLAKRGKPDFKVR